MESLKFLFLVTIAAIAFADIPRRPLSPEENSRRKLSCGRYQGAIRRSMFSHVQPPTEGSWAVAISQDDDWFPEKSETFIRHNMLPHCSGTLISSRHVLTAAHCFGKLSVDCKRDPVMEFEKRNVERLRVTLGSPCATKKVCRVAKMDYEPTVRAVKRVIWPKEYDQNKCDFAEHADLAILELDEDVEFSNEIYPACMPNQAADPFFLFFGSGEVLNVYGYGEDAAQDKEKSVTAYMLKTSAGKVNGCPPLSLHSFYLDVQCLYSRLGGPCAGDSGSGAVEYKNQMVTVKAVISAGPSCQAQITYGYNKYNPMHLYAESKFHDIVTNVAHHMGWICGTTGICEDFAAPVGNKTAEIGPLEYDEIFAL